MNSYDHKIDVIKNEINELKREMKINNKLILIKELHEMGEITDEQYIEDLKKAYKCICN